MFYRESALARRFIERQYFKVAEAVDRGDVEPRWIPTDLNLADVLTKPVSRQVMEKIGPMLNGNATQRIRVRGSAYGVCG